MSSPDRTVQVTTPSATEIRITRDFAFPREQVWRAYTDPELVARWLCGPEGWVTTSCEIDLRTDGAYRHEWRHDDGRQMALVGRFLEVERPTRMVRTESFEFGCEAQAGEQHATAELLEIADGTATRVVTTIRFPSQEARDATLASGMAEGIGASFAGLETLLAAEAHA